MDWISVDDRLPNNSADGVNFYTFEYGKVRDDAFYSAFPRDSDGWGHKCEGKCFYNPNMDSDYGGEFKSDAVTHWMEKDSLPEPPK